MFHPQYLPVATLPVVLLLSPDTPLQELSIIPGSYFRWLSHQYNLLGRLLALYNHSSTQACAPPPPLTQPLVARRPTHHHPCTPPASSPSRPRKQPLRRYVLKCPLSGNLLNSTPQPNDPASTQTLPNTNRPGEKPSDPVPGITPDSYTPSPSPCSSPSPNSILSIPSSQYPSDTVLSSPSSSICSNIPPNTANNSNPTSIVSTTNPNVDSNPSSPNTNTTTPDTTNPLAPSLTANLNPSTNSNTVTKSNVASLPSRLTALQSLFRLLVHPSPSSSPVFSKDPTEDRFAFTYLTNGLPSVVSLFQIKPSPGCPSLSNSSLLKILETSICDLSVLLVDNKFSIWFFILELPRYHGDFRKLHNTSFKYPSK